MSRIEKRRYSHQRPLASGLPWRHTYCPMKQTFDWTPQPSLRFYSDDPTSWHSVHRGSAMSITVQLKILSLGICIDLEWHADIDHVHVTLQYSERGGQRVGNCFLVSGIRLILLTSNLTQQADKVVFVFMILVKCWEIIIWNWIKTFLGIVNCNFNGSLLWEDNWEYVDGKRFSDQDE